MSSNVQPNQVADAGTGQPPAPVPSETTAVPTPAIPTADGVVAPVAPTPVTQPPADAGSTRNEDVDRVKSVLQQQIALEQRRQAMQAAQLEALQAQLHQQQEELFGFKTAGMDDTEKRAFELEQRVKAMEAQEQARLAADAENQRWQAAYESQQKAIQYYSYMTGLPPEKLVEYADSPTNLTAFAANYVRQRMAQATQVPPQPPNVTQNVPAASPGKILSSWDNVDKATRDGWIEDAKAGRLHDSDL